MEEIGLMGGTFNPMHTRELMVAQCAAEQFFLKKVIFIPNGTPPHKKVDVLDKFERLEMVEAGVKDNPLFEASRVEVDRPGITWSIDTLKHFKEQFGEGVRLNFIVGEDVLKSLVRYERREELLKLCRLLVSPRDSASPDVDSWRALLPEAQIEMIDCPPDGRSSTLIRTWIRAGKSVRYLVPPAVHDILLAKGHYKDSMAATAAPAAVSATAAETAAPAPAAQPAAAATPGQAVVPAPEPSLPAKSAETQAALEPKPICGNNGSPKAA